MPFQKLLIANRAEIACRIMRTATKLGISTVAVFSEADRNSLHVAQADEAVDIGSSSPSKSYLNIDKIIAAAKSTGATAIHPGYGFLSENYKLAEQCQANDLAFIGPRADAIRQMASKSIAAQIAHQASVETLPGYRGASQDPRHMLEAAIDVGFPILLKSALGGGGRGMRIVENEKDFALNLKIAQSESMKAFGDDEIILEKYLVSARHIEVQIAADKHGHCLALGNRDCSAQRRYQKIIEEAPAPSISESVRQAMHDSSVRLAQQLDYDNLGTVEFLLQDDDFYFMEMNTRLQVEHPVTEQIVGVDLVAWQLQIAAGESIETFGQPSAVSKHAIEARIYAESPANGFRPSPGLLELVQFPRAATNLQVHTGVRQGDTVSEFYDPMIAKIVATGRNRTDAIARLVNALSQTFVAGVEVNVGFLIDLLNDAAILQGAIHINYVETNLKSLMQATQAPANEMLALGILVYHLRAREKQTNQAPYHSASDMHSPWLGQSGWRMNAPCEFAYVLTSAGTTYAMSVQELDAAKFCVAHASLSLQLRLNCFNEQSISAEIDGKMWELSYFCLDASTVMFCGSSRFEFSQSGFSDTPTFEQEDGKAGLAAPLPGRVAHISVHKGDHVRKGDCVAVVEAMKIEHQLCATTDGIVAKVHIAVGDSVAEGAICVDIEHDTKKAQDG